MNNILVVIEDCKERKHVCWLRKLLVKYLKNKKWEGWKPVKQLNVDERKYLYEDFANQKWGYL